MNAGRFISLPCESAGERRLISMLRPIAVVATVVALSAAPAQGEAADERTAPVGPTSHIRSVIDREDIELSGLSSVSDLLSSRRAFNSFGLRRPSFGTGATTYLVNGRNVSGLDLSTLPISAIERVEILDEGPVRYGGDALSGAVNIVLRNDYEGIEASAGVGLPTQKGRDSRHGSALWGGTVGHGHLTIGAAHISREEVRDKDRHFSRAMWTPGGAFADTTGVSDHGNTIVLPEVGRRALGDCNESIYTGTLTHPGGEVCGYAYADISWLYSRFTRESLFLIADQPLGDDADVYVEARVAQGDSLFRYAPPVGDFTFQPTGDVRERLLDSVQNLDSTYDLPDDPDDPNDGNVRVLHRFVGHGNREWRTDLEEYEFTFGVRGTLDGGLGYDTHVEYYRHKTVEEGVNLVSERLARTAIEGGDYDIANPLSPSDAARHRQAIRDMALRLTHDTLNEHMRAGAALEGTAFTMPGGAVRWTAGIEVEDREWRDIYDYRDSRNRFHEVADVLGSGGESVAGERRRWSALAETIVPVLDGWDLTLSARRDDFDDVGEAISLRIANRFRLNDDLAFRASWDRGARPPGLGNLHLPDALYFVPVCDPLVTDEKGNPDCGVAHMVIRGNPNLGPDEAERVSIGATARLGAFSLTADWFAVEIADEPTIAHWQTIVDRAAAGNPLPGTEVKRHEGNDIDTIVSPIGQFGETEAEGIALDAGAAWETDWVDLALDVHAQRTIRYEERVLGVKQPGDYPRDRVHALLRATWGDVTASWNIHAISGYNNTTKTGRFKRWYGHDLALQWRDVVGTGLDLTGGVLNVANRGPSTDSSGDSDPDLTLDSVRGRTFFLSATMVW